MRSIKGQNSALAVLGIVVVFAIFVLVVLPRINHPLPAVHTFGFAPGGVARAIVEAKYSKGGGRRGGLPLSFLPHHLDFEFTDGAAAVYVVRYPTGSLQHQLEEVARLTDQFKAGQTPKKIIAQASGNRGRINLNWFPYGSAKYVVLIRSETASGGELLIHYGP